MTGSSASPEHYWDVWNSGTSVFGSEAIVANTSAYDTTKGLKTGESFYVRQSSGSPNWSLHHSNTYSYESTTDFLTGASYGDGASPSSSSWSYDHAGNRSNSGYTYDNLNRMTASPWASYSNDLVGNRSSETSGLSTSNYTWDVLNRLVDRTNVYEGVTTGYTYRSDGLRTKKVTTTGTSTVKTDHYRYDGQMPFENESLTRNGTSPTASITATREALGARGIDAEEAVTGTYTVSTGARSLNTPTISFPLYDAHGNRMCSLSRSGTDYFTTDTVRYYGAWGEVRVGNTTGDSIWRYCASLGHVQDDESGLIYMRARYYEPISGRFISEDPEAAGNNWFTYCKSNPINYWDESGRKPSPFILMGVLIMMEAWKEMLNDVRKGHEINFLRMTLKVGEAIIVTVISEKTAAIIASMWGEVQAGYKAQFGVGVVLTFYASYATLLLTALDIAAYEGMEAMVDFLCPESS